jgi:hypothetical protein
MQTFLPYPDFEKSAKVLDNKRLGKQRVEAKQILIMLNGILNGLYKSNSPFKNHPAVRMWKGYEEALSYYLISIINEWLNRGFENNITYQILNESSLSSCKKHYKSPPWLGDKRLHYSHRANLMRKNSEYYSQFKWDVDINAPYWWPVMLKNKQLQRTIDEYYNMFFD